MALLLYAVETDRALKRERVLRDRINPLDSLTDEQLILRYRFPRSVILDLIDSIHDSIGFSSSRNSPISEPVQVLVALQFYATGSFLQTTADLFHVHRSTVSRIIRRVSNAFANLAQTGIKFPANTEDLIRLKVEFNRISSIPNVVGCIDGTHIPIRGPRNEEYNYVNRKNYHSINCQAVCDGNLRLMNWVVKFPGGVHDAFIWNNCALHELFENGDITGWLLGDSAYALKPYMLTPFLNPRSRPQLLYNGAHAKARNSIERTFGVMKARFRAIHKSGGALQFSPERACKIILAIGWLHNKAIENRLPDPPDLESMIETEAAEGRAMNIVYDNDSATGTAARDKLVAVRFS